MKTCLKCKKSKDKINFIKDSSSLDGLTVWCRICRNLNTKNWYYKNKQFHNESYYENCKIKNKKCASCKEELDISNFLRSPGSKDGFYAYCYECHKFRQANNPKTKYYLYKTEANKRKLKFDISFDFFKKLFYKSCFYCGEHKTPMGIDRVNNMIGYINENCVSCCKECNYKKGSVTPEICEKILKFLGEKNE